MALIGQSNLFDPQKYQQFQQSQSAGKLASGLGLSRNFGNLLGLDKNLGAGLGAFSGLARAYGAYNNPFLSDAKKALGVTSGSLSALGSLSGSPYLQSIIPGLGYLNTGVNIGGSTIPYASIIGTGLNVADVATNDQMDDGQKAFNAAAAVGSGVADYFLPGAGTMANVLTALVNHLAWPNEYAKTRAREAGDLPGAYSMALGPLGLATTLDELKEIGNLGTIYASQGPVFNPGTKTFGWQGTHLDTTGPEQGYNKMFQDRMALIQRAEAGDAQARAELEKIRKTVDPMVNDINTIYKLTGIGDYSKLGAKGRVPTLLEIASLANPNGPAGGNNPYRSAHQQYGLNQPLNQIAQSRLDDWVSGYEQFKLQDQGRTPASAPHVIAMKKNIDDLSGASQRLGFGLYDPEDQMSMLYNTNDHYRSLRDAGMSHSQAASLVQQHQYTGGGY